MVYKNPIEVRFKQNDAGLQGVSGGGKKTKMSQNRSQGREQTEKSVTIKVYNDLPYKPYDAFKILGEDTNYIIKEVYEDYSSTNAINNLQFPKMRKNKSYVLVMGER
jgi:hypothetical protein